MDSNNTNQPEDQGEYNQSIPTRGEYNQTPPNQGQYMQGQYTQNQYNQGQYNPYYNGQNPSQPRGGKGFGIAALILGIVALISSCCCSYFSAIPGILAIIFAIIQIKKQGPVKGLAIAGLILGIIGILLGVAFFVVSNMVISSNPELFRSMFYETYEEFYDIL